MNFEELEKSYQECCPVMNEPPKQPSRKRSASAAFTEESAKFKEYCINNKLASPTTIACSVIYHIQKKFPKMPGWYADPDLYQAVKAINYSVAIVQSKYQKKVKEQHTEKIKKQQSLEADQIENEVIDLGEQNQLTTEDFKSL